MITKYFFKNIFFISLILFLIKWFLFLDVEKEIDLITKFIFEIRDWQYFTLIYNLSDLNFNPSYNPNLTSLRFLPLPIYSIIYHSLFYYIFDIYGFIIIEFFIILLFFYILSNFFLKLGINKIEAIFLALLIFCLPDIIDFFQLSKIQYVSSLKELYNLRIPRPSVSHLYLFLFFLVLIDIKKKTEFKFSQLALIGIIFALMFGSYYYNLAICGITFIIYYFYIIYESNQKISKIIKDFFIVSIFFIFFSIPVILILLNSEPDYLIRVGLVELDIPKKKILLNHFVSKILDIKFIITFIIINFLYMFLKIKKIHKVETLNLLYFIFLGAFLSPLIFILIAPTISEPYNFINMLIALSFFILLIFSFLILISFTNNLSWSRNLFKTGIISLIFFYGFSNYSLNENENQNIKQTDFSQLIKEIKKINIDKKSSILTFDAMVQTSLILNDYKNLTFVIGINTSMDDESIENRLINIFKFLNLNEIDFNNFIKNEKYEWRFINENIGATFYGKYQANRLITYKDSMDFSLEELEYISKSSPLHSQQLILPAFEIERLTKKFVNYTNYEKINPELIIINNNNPFTKNLFLDNNFYCSKIVNKTFKIYLIKKNNINC
tara:strand:- start:1939 stop:3771 length:1833 start_codon:yes stop_codon:yes gene_type:complete